MSWQSKSAAVAIAIMAMSLHSSSVQAMPEQGKVVAGQGEIARPDDKTMVINQKTDRLALDWQKFNIAKDEKVHFDQNNKSAIAINRVVGDGRSIIDGSLSATGNVFVINPNGVLFGKNSSVDVGGLVASTANVTDDDLKNFTQGKGDLNLQIAAGREASVINAGTIKAEGGLVALHATTVENTGTIANEGGTTALAAAKNLNIAADTAGKLNFTVNGSLANAKALNSGTLQSDGGYIVMTAKSAGDVMSTVVNNTGIIEAKTLHTNDKGEILLDGGASGQVEVSSTLNASGMEAEQSAGSIKVIGEKTIVNDGTNLLARGTIDGGKIETSGDVLNLGNNLNINAKGESGKAGEWLLDPLDVIIADSDPTGSYDSSTTDIRKYDGTTSSITGDTTIAYHDPAATTADAASTNTAVTWINSKTINDLLNNGTDVKIQAAATNGVANITVNSAISKTAGDDATFTLEAMRNITINKDITSSSGKLNVFLNSDTNGNQVGAVIINADIDTHGGNFISASGGNLVYSAKDGTKKGYDKGAFKAGTAADPNGATVGTYFGHIDDKTLVADGLLGNRSIKTEGGSITLNGEVAIGLAGGTLTLDSTEKESNKKITNSGDIKVTGIINSGNSYTYYIKGTDAWNNLLTSTKDKDGNTIIQQYLNAGTVPSYHYKAVNYEYEKNADGSYKKDEKGNYVYKKDTNGNYVVTGAKQPVKGPHYTYSEVNTEDPRWTANKIGYSTLPGDGWTSFEITGTSIADSMTVKEFLQYYKTAAAANFKAKYSSIDLTQNNAKIVATIKADSNLLAALTSDINDLLSVNWFAAKTLAQGSTNGGSGVNDTYLATITTILENSLTAPNGKTALFVGGRGSGVRNKIGSTDNDKMYPYSYYGMPDDPTYQNGMYWVTGPEGEVKNSDGTTGTQFYSNVNSNWANKNYGETVYGYANWATWTDGSILRSQPDNNSPFLTVGYGTNNQWDDVAMGGGYGGAESAWAKGFVQEKNLQHSSLNVQAGNSTVNLQGNIGGSEELDTVKINTTGSVTTGGSTVTDYNMGTINADHGVTINGSDVMIGGRITTGSSTNSAISNATDNVSITSAGNLKVHGITANGKTGANGTVVNGGKISLVSDSDKGIIIIEGTTNSKKGEHKNADGTEYAGDEEPDNGGLIAGSSADGAVVIDSRGKTGAFINRTTSNKAIDAKGKWQVYVASPSDYGTILGDNLNSETNAQWSSESTKKSTTDVSDKNAAGKDIGTYTDNTHNKFIFQVTPVITISGGYKSKTYGDALPEEAMAGTLTSKEIYKDSSNNDIDVTTFKNFDESHYLEYVTISDGTKTGLATVNVSSDGAKETATRTNGNEKVEGSDAYKTATDKNRAFYVMDVTYKDGVKTLNGYDNTTNPGEVKITRKTLTINTDGKQIYGNNDIVKTPSDYTNQLVGTDKLSADDITYTISTTGEYEKSKGTTGTTAHVGTYTGEYLTTAAKIKDGNGNDASANYDVIGSGTITVTPSDLYLTVGNVSTTYGTPFDTDKYTYTIDKEKGGLVNGDTQTSVLGDKFLSYTNTGAVTDPDKIAKGATTQNAGEKYELQGATTKNLTDYTVHITNGTSTVKKATLHLSTGDDTEKYGAADKVQKYLDRATTITSGKANGDTVSDLLSSLGIVNTSQALLDKDRTNDVKYKTDGSTPDTYDIDTVYKPLENYNVVLDKKGTITLTPKAITIKNTMTQQYGSSEKKFSEATVPADQLANGDTISTKDLKFDIVPGGKYEQSLKENQAEHADAVSADAGTYAGELVHTGGGITHADGTDAYKNYIVTVEGDIVVTPADLTVKINDASTQYGTPFDEESGKKSYDYTVVSGNANGDTTAEVKDLLGQLKNYKNDGVGENGRATKDVGSYGITGEQANKLTNYTVKIENGTATVDPKDVYFHVTGNGKTFGDVVYTVTDPNHPSSSNPINGQLAYGETVTPSYRPDGRLPNGHYGVSTSIDGKTISDKDVYGNYRYHYDGDVTLSMPNKPDFEPPVNPPVTPGTGTVTPLPEQPTNPSSNTPENTTETTGHKTVWDGERDRGGDRPEDKRVVTLPFFKVLEDKTTHRYGTYDVAKRTTEVKIEPSAQVLPEPNQPATQYRELTTELTTDKGTGEFTLKYNGSRFTILPDDDAAMKLIVVGDETKNRALFEKALHVAFTQMGLEVADLDGVYIHFGKD